MQPHLWRAFLYGTSGVIGLAGLAAVPVLLAGGDASAAWAVTLLFWSAALLVSLALAIRREDPVEDYLSRHERLAGPRRGAQLPG